MEGHHDFVGHVGLQTALLRAAELLRAPVSETEPWIACADRYPRNYQTVLLTDGDGICSTGFWNGSRWMVDLCEGSSDPHLTPTHWVPLPAAPKDEPDGDPQGRDEEAREDGMTNGEQSQSDKYALQTPVTDAAVSECLAQSKYEPPLGPLVEAASRLERQLQMSMMREQAALQEARDVALSKADNEIVRLKRELAEMTEERDRFAGQLANREYDAELASSSAERSPIKHVGASLVGQLRIVAEGYASGDPDLSALLTLAAERIEELQRAPSSELNNATVAQSSAGPRASASVEHPESNREVAGENPAGGSSSSSKRPMNCREAGPGRGLCEKCANGEYEKCLYMQPRAQSSHEQRSSTVDLIIAAFRDKSPRGLAIALADHGRFMEADVAHWKRMYECAQNANAYRQDAIEGAPASAIRSSDG
jgi:Protein of unknown function (DUF551)